MKIFNYVTLLIALFMINIMYAELKTFGEPADTETEQLPSEENSTDETPNEEAPSEETPSEEAPGEENPIEETPSEETPSEETPSEEAPDGDDEMPSATEDNEISNDQPVKFKEEYLVSIQLGSSMPFGQNLKSNFSSGLNLQADISTPFSFSGIKLIGHFSICNLSASGPLSSNFTDYSVKNIGIKLSRNVSVLKINLGTGLSIASGKTMYTPYEDYNMTTLFLSGSLSYDLPLSGVFENIAGGRLENLKVSVTAGGIEIFGAPSDGGTSDIIDFGVAVSYPFLF